MIFFLADELVSFSVPLATDAKPFQMFIQIGGGGIHTDWSSDYGTDFNRQKLERIFNVLNYWSMRLTSSGLGLLPDILL